MTPNPEAPTLYVLSGLPGTGKTTWREHKAAELRAAGRTVTVCSPDDLVTDAATALGVTYAEAIRIFELRRLFNAVTQQAARALKSSGDVIVDRLNLTPKTRSIVMRYAGMHRRVAVAFEAPRTVIVARNKARELDGRAVPLSILEGMIPAYVRPEPSEGFDEVEVLRIDDPPMPL
jgi:predicted kinase